MVPRTQKIPCSVSLLTLNAADSLQACLEALKDFEEIIVCDGNSTDATREIAERFGARVIRQYDTDEKNVPCAMDKAAVRQRAMDASTLPWRFFMDADDTLSPEAVEEVARIVSDPEPAHYIWRMPTRIFIHDKEVLHEATYPSYQTRLVHERVGARFKGPVHDHLVWDASAFPAGTMRSYYNFGWPDERVAHFWRYQRLYVKRELQTASYDSLQVYLRWGLYFRVRIIAGYLLWRLPAMYLRYGFKDSLPLWMELEIVGYHALLLLGASSLYLRTRPWFIVLRERLRGAGRRGARLALEARSWEAYGRTLSIGSPRECARLWPYIRSARWHRMTFATMEEMQSGALPEGYFDTVIACEPVPDARHARKLLRPGGTLYAAS